MGNVGKAFSSKEEYLYYFVNRNEHQHIISLLKKHPELLNQPITKQTKQTALMRAAYNGNYETTQLLIKEGCDVNHVSSKKQTALSVAVKRNHLSIVKLLIENEADVNHVSKNDISIIDLAILPGFYDIAFFIYPRLKQKKLKQAIEYEELGKKSYRYVNYEMMIEGIQNEREQNQIGNFLKKEKVVLRDPVPDPRESWGEWFKRNLQFKDAPMVERDDLPQELRPQNRKLGKVDIFIHNWVRTSGKKRTSFNPKDRKVMSQLGELNHKQNENTFEYHSQA